MSDQQVCPVCGSPLSADESRCSKCGLKLADRTQSFSPVSVEGETSVVTEDDSAQLALTVSKGTYAGQVFDLNCPKLVIGRDPSCDIFLNDMTVSREHAVVTCEDGETYIEDMGSLNGTWINGEIKQKARLSVGMTVQIGTFSMTVEAA